jgi:Icc-related predicted phosphoesterase
VNIKLTFISDTHNKHSLITEDDLKGGDILIHSGDISSMGYEHEIRRFLKWFSGLNQFKHKIFIAGNHDWMFERNSLLAKEILKEYPNIIYLQDSSVTIDGIKIYCSPWQPTFYDWAFNLPRNGEKLKWVWDMIPEDTDILVTHGPPYGYGDTVHNRLNENLGCYLLKQRVEQVKPIIHCFGHIHTGTKISKNEHTTFINAAVLDEKYDYVFRPIDVKLDIKNKKIDPVLYKEVKRALV